MRDSHNNTWVRIWFYYSIVADGKVKREAAKHIIGYVAFWKGVQVDAR
jgi:hypothetical protein